MIKYTIKLNSDNSISLLHGGKLVPCCHVLSTLTGKTVFAFHGQMGAGKTTFIKQLSEELGTTDVVNSPTFAIVNVYDLPQGSKYGNEMYHFDCYRLKDIREAVDFGAEDYLYSGNLCFIEWPDIIEPLLPDDTVHISIIALDNGDRELIVND